VLTVLFSASALLLAAAAAPAAAGPLWDPGFGRNPLWNDGKAEVAVYDARDLRYGLPRSSRAVLIVVAEDLSPSKLVKLDDPRAAASTIRVLKLNHVRSIPTGVYTYQQMLSVFLGAERLDPVKLSVTSHEWCGNSFVEWRSDRRQLSIRSYFENGGDRDVPLDPGDALFYDALPLKLRSLDFARVTEAKVVLYESVFSNAPAPPPRSDALLRVTRPAGSVYRVELLRGGRTDRFDFGDRFPHHLLRWERADGGVLTLVDSRRFRYWEENAPGDEKLLPGAAGR
jgi:hypothetical protein